MSEELPIRNPKKSPEDIKKTSITKREFLKKSLQGHGGLILGTYRVSEPNSSSKKKESKEQIGIKTKVLFPESADNIFPDSWRKKPISATFLPLDKLKIEKSEKVIKLALNKYPPEVLNVNLKKVFLVKDMSFYNNRYGATNSLEDIYIANKGYTDKFLEEALHHELSSILLRNFSGFFDKDEFASINPSGFIYLDKTYGVESVSNGMSDALDNSLHEKGFLSEYAMSSIENDFNGIAEKIFSGTSEIWELTNKYPRIKNKVQLVIHFYEKVNQIFNEKYFRSIAN